MKEGRQRDDLYVDIRLYETTLSGKKIILGQETREEVTHSATRAHF